MATIFCTSSPAGPPLPLLHLLVTVPVVMGKNVMRSVSVAHPRVPLPPPSVASTLGATEWATDTERMTFLPITTGTVSSKWSKGSGGPAGDEVQNMVAIEACYDMRGNGDGKTCNTLTGDHANRPTDYTPVVCVNAREDPIAISGKSLPLGAKDTGHGIVPLDLRKVQRDPEKESGLGIGKTGEPVYALCAGREVNGIINNLDVRRLTPTECERLQGFPDGWTQVPYRNKPAADGPRYKALGNACLLYTSDAADE